MTISGPDVFAVLAQFGKLFAPLPSEYFWWYVGLKALFEESILMEYLFATHLFMDLYVGPLFEGLSKYGYCVESHNSSSFFWIIVAVYFEYGRRSWDGRPRSLTWKTAIFMFCTGLNLVGQVLSSSCSISGDAFAAFLGAVLGLLKVYAYSAVFDPFVLSVTRRESSPQIVKKE
jgi:hypothetical protein